MSAWQGENPVTYTRFMWANDVLSALGNPNPSLYTQNWMVCWTTFETAYPNSAAYNLLNTTQSYNGSIGGGKQGDIQWYKSYADGISATAMTLTNGNYATLENALINNDQATLATAGGNGIAQNLSTWGTGNASSIADCANSGGTSAQNQTFGPSNVSGGTPTGSTGAGGSGGTGLTSGLPSGSLGVNPLQPIIDWFHSLQPLWDWIGNPIRVLKLVTGIILIALAISMLVAPDAVQTIKKHPEILLGA